jgi:ribokinase
MDFLAVGDVVVDAFIRLHEARVHCNINDEQCEICMRWGDKIPFESSTVVPAVGNASNAAVAAARLGLSSALRAYVGDDPWGAQCVAALGAEQVALDFVEKQAGKKTNYHYVLWFEGQRTILVKHEQFDYAVPAVAEAPKWLYLSSLGENSLPYHKSLSTMLERWPQTRLVFQPGTYQMQFGKEALEAVYKRTNLFFCNKEEAERILGLPPTDPRQLLAAMRALGPKAVVITDDVRGAYALDESGAMWLVPRYPDPRAPYEITGAGDAFASTTVIALALGKDFGEALKWGAVNASAVLQEIGAQKGLLSRAQLEKNLMNPPAAFDIKPL